MRTKTYTVEVVRTSRVLVTLPETYEKPEVLKEWNEYLFHLANGVDTVAEYAGQYAVDYDHRDIEGVGVLLTSPYDGEPDYEKDKFQVKAIVVDDEIETKILDKTRWTELPK